MDELSEVKNDESKSEDNRTRLEKLEEKMAKLRRQISLEKKRESDKERRERTHRLVRQGGLVEMVLGDAVDAGILTGLLIKNKNIFAAPDSAEAQELKRQGDRLIAEREAERLRKRAQKSGNNQQSAAS